MKSATNVLSRPGSRLAPPGLFVAMLLVIAAHRGESQTTLEAYRVCADAAAVAASNCYTKADGYVANKLCDWAWDARLIACAARILQA